MTDHDQDHADGDDRLDPEGLTGILEAIEHAVTSARSMPMSSSVLINRAELLDLVQQAHDVLPTQLTQADQVLADADSAREAARSEAEKVLAKARAQAAELVQREQIVTDAEERAEQIIAEAEQTALELRRDADDYCDRRLADFEIDLGRIIAQVQAGRAKLADRLGPMT